MGRILGGSSASAKEGKGGISASFTGKFPEAGNTALS